jgi:hypothetical protein
MGGTDRRAPSTIVRVTRLTAAIGVVWVLGGHLLSSGAMVAQPPRAGHGPREHVVIPFLANAAKPADLTFEGGECDVDQSGDTMECQFQQVFLTTSDLAPLTCLITTNRYERTFHKQTSTRWVSREGPTGVCGTIDVTTLQDDGGVRWTMDTERVVTNRDAAPECHGVGERPETLSWQNIRRPLPCTFVQPGGISR